MPIRHDEAAPAVQKNARETGTGIYARVISPNLPSFCTKSPATFRYTHWNTQLFGRRAHPVTAGGTTAQDMHRTSQGLTFPPQAWPKFLAHTQEPLLKEPPRRSECRKMAEICNQLTYGSVCWIGRYRIGRAVPALFPKQGSSPSSEVGSVQTKMRRGARRWQMHAYFWS